MPRRSLLFAAPAAVLTAATLLPGAPAQAAAPPDTWASTCADADATFCIESATITQQDTTVPLVEAGLTATVTSEAGDLGSAVRWSVDGFTEGASPGLITLVLRTGSFVPRMTAATAAQLTVDRTGDDLTGHTLTVTGLPTWVDWTTSPEFAEACTARQYCGDYDTMADAAGTGLRFQGLTQDLAAAGADLAEAMDGAYLYTDAQAHAESLTSDAGVLSLGQLGNPQLDQDGIPALNAVTAWVPGSWFAAAGTTVEDAITTGFDAVADSDGRSDSIPIAAVPENGGVRLDVQEIGFGSALGTIQVYGRPSPITEFVTVTSVPTKATARADGQGSVTVSWSPPAFTTGTEVLGYRARVRKAAGPDISTVARCDTEELSCTIEGLDPDQPYLAGITAINLIGESRPAMASVAMVEPLSEPRQVRAVSGPRRITVSWLAPLSDGGSPIEGYTVSAFPGPDPDDLEVASCEASAAKRSCVLSVSTGATVHVFVSAVTEADFGPPSEAVAARAWTVAGVPRSPGAKSARGRVTVNWTAPATNGGTAVTGYQATLWTAARGGTVVTRCSAAASARSCVTPALKAGRTYYATVAATNAAGTSTQPARVRVTVR